MDEAINLSNTNNINNTTDTEESKILYKFLVPTKDYKTTGYYEFYKKEDGTDWESYDLEEYRNLIIKTCGETKQIEPNFICIRPNDFNFFMVLDEKKS